jgi:parallel beta-helix repeat protein
MDSVDEIEALEGKCVTEGRLNVHRAVLKTPEYASFVTLDRQYYSCSDEINIIAGDSELAGDGTTDVNVVTSDGNDLETVTLTETPSDSGLFFGSIATSPNSVSAQSGYVEVSDGEILTVTFSDTNDIATIDCAYPVISNIDFNDTPIGPDIAITFDTNEFAVACVRYGTSCSALNKSDSSHRGISHTIKLSKPSPSTDNHFIIEVTDRAGNTTIDNNDASCYTLTTDGPVEINVPSDFNSIQEAIDQPIWDGSTITVEDGTYYELIDFKGKGVAVTSEDPNDWDVVADTIIDLEGKWVMFHSGEDANSVLKGLTVQNGKYGIWSSYFTSPLIANCIIKNNTRRGIGCKFYARPVISHCIITNNPDGIFSEYSSTPIVTNCIIKNNTNYGIYCYRDSCPLIANNKIYDNSNGISGIHNSAPTIENNWIYHNANYGLYFTIAIFVDPPIPIRNNTIAYNAGDGISVGVAGANPVIGNCIIWGHDGDDLVDCNATYSCIQDVNDANGTGNITDDPLFINIWEFRDQTDANGEPNTVIVADANAYDYDINDVIEYDNDGIVRTISAIDANTITFSPALDANSVEGVRIFNWGPEITDVNEDFGLQIDSPCIDAGDPNGDYSGQTDIDGDPRVMCSVDIGADEAECFPPDFNDYDDWVALGKPDCWCYCWPYQCDGDADGATTGDPNYYRVSQDDYDLVYANWKKKIDDFTLDPCADIDHKSETFFKYRVFGNDLAIITANWHKTDAELDGDCPRDE